MGLSSRKIRGTKRAGPVITYQMSHPAIGLVVRGVNGGGNKEKGLRWDRKKMGVGENAGREEEGTGRNYVDGGKTGMPSNERGDRQARETGMRGERGRKKRGEGRSSGVNQKRNPYWPGKGEKKDQRLHITKRGGARGAGSKRTASEAETQERGESSCSYVVKYRKQLTSQAYKGGKGSTDEGPLVGRKADLEKHRGKNKRREGKLVLRNREGKGPRKTLGSRILEVVPERGGLDEGLVEPRQSKRFRERSKSRQAKAKKERSLNKKRGCEVKK